MKETYVSATGTINLSSCPSKKMPKVLLLLEENKEDQFLKAGCPGSKSRLATNGYECVTLAELPCPFSLQASLLSCKTGMTIAILLLGWCKD